MFWRMAEISTTFPVDSILDKGVYTLEELLDEEQIIQECKASNSRLINFFRTKAQVQQMIHYVIDEAPDGADSKRAFKFPFVSCQIFTCEIDMILKTLVEDEELMNLLFSFLDTSRPHGTLLAGYFSKVVICLLLRKTNVVMQYLQSHQDVLKRLVDLIGITSIKEVLMRLVGAEDLFNSTHADALKWLADTDLLEMLVDKLSPENGSEVHSNAAEILSTVTQTAPSALASKLSSPMFVGRLFNHALEDPQSKSTLIHSLSVCISLLDPKRRHLTFGVRSQHVLEALPAANPETVEGMVQKLGDLLELLNVSNDENVLPTTYGELRPPFGIHRLKIVEFIAVMLRTNSEIVRQELIRLGAIRTMLDYFFIYPFNNMLHNHVESIVNSCLDSACPALVDNLFKECNFVTRLLEADANPFAPDTRPEPRASGEKPPPRVGNLGHLTRIANRLVQVGSSNTQIQDYLKANSKWNEWQNTTLHERNILENVYQWTCGRPTTVRDRTMDSDDDEFRDRDYDVANMASNLTREVYRYGMFENEDLEGEDVFFDDEAAESVMSNLHLSDEPESGQFKESLFDECNPTWFAFSDGRPNNSTGLISSPASRIDDSEMNIVSLPCGSGSSSSSDDEVIVGDDDELGDTATSSNGDSLLSELDRCFERKTRHDALHEASVNSIGDVGLADAGLSDDLLHNENTVGVSEVKDWTEFQSYGVAEGSGREIFGENPFVSDPGPLTEAAEASSLDEFANSVEAEAAEVDAHAALESLRSIPCETDNAGHISKAELLSEYDEHLGAEKDGMAKAMESALREGIVGEAGPLKPKPVSTESEVDFTLANSMESQEFNDLNFWRNDYDHSVAQEEQVS